MTTAARGSFILCLTAVLFGSLAAAQSTSSAQSSAVVPRLVNFLGKATDAQGKSITGIAGITFSIYNEQNDGAPLWMETQNVTADAKGNYTVQLGATKSDGLPLDLFTSGEARWLGVRVNNGEEQPRILLLSVPYALKAADAETVGGLPASAFVLAAPPTANAIGATSASEAASVTSATSSDVTTTGGTVDTIPLFTTAANVQNSLLTQTGTAAINVVGKLNLPALGTATASTGFNSRPHDFVASSYNSSSKAAVAQTFQLQAEPAGNDTAAPSGTLNLLYSSGTAAPAETGLKISNKGLITFAAGQTFPTVTGNEAVSGDLTASELISTVATGTAPIKVTSTTEVANLNASLLGGKAASAFGQLAASNTFTGFNYFNAGLEATSGETAMVGATSGQGFRGMYGIASATSGGSTGVFGTTQDASGAGVLGINQSASGNPSGGGVVGVSNGSSADADGVLGEAEYGNGVVGVATGTFAYGIEGFGFNALSGSGEDGSLAIYARGGDGDPNNPREGADGIDSYGGNGGTGGSDGKGGYFLGGSGTSYGDGIYAAAGSSSASAWAGDFLGDVNIVGTLYAGAKDFKIDHPLDPANKYLVHTSVESSEMMNIYTGNITTDAQGLATVQLPDWFEALNTDFRYQLTVIGQFAQAIVSREIQNHEFAIRTSASGVKVSWQVTGVRQDAFAKAHPLTAEQDKGARLRGFYIHPELYGAPPEKQIEWARHPRIMKRMQEHRQQMKEKEAQPSQSAALPHGSR